MAEEGLKLIESSKYILSIKNDGSYCLYRESDKSLLAIFTDLQQAFSFVDQLIKQHAANISYLERCHGASTKNDEEMR